MSEEFIARLREKCPYCVPCSADKLAAADLIVELERDEAQAHADVELMRDVGDEVAGKLRAALERAEREIARLHTDYNREYVADTEALWGRINRVIAAAKVNAYGVATIDGDDWAAFMATTRPCPNSVSWCGGPDRYGDTCKACLATWTEEAAK